MAARAPTTEHRDSPYDPRRPLTRVLLGLATGLVIACVLMRRPWAVRIVAGWIALGTIELLLALSIIASCGPDETRRWASQRVAGRVFASVVVQIASAVALCLAIYLLRHATSSGARRPLVALCTAAVALSWLSTHLTYAARYARLYFGEPGVLRFPDGAPPDYWDFTYFAFTLGMCFQVSDVEIAGRAMRRAVLGHALLSFAYNTAVLALALNLVAGL